MQLLFLLVPNMSVITDTCASFIAKDLVLKIDRRPGSDLDAMRWRIEASWGIIEACQNGPPAAASRRDRHKDHRCETKD